MKLLVNAPINALSFGNVSVNILKELYKKNIDLCLFPIGNKTEIKLSIKLIQNSLNTCKMLQTKGMKK